MQIIQRSDSHYRNSWRRALPKLIHANSLALLKLVFVALLLLNGYSGFSQEADYGDWRIKKGTYGNYEVLDKFGKPVTFKQDNSGNRIMQDDFGRTLATFIKDSGEIFVVKDGFSKIQLVYKPSVFGYKLEDGDGYEIASFKTDIFEKKVITDSQKTSTFKKDIFGNLIEEDEKGKAKRVYKKDIFGNKIVEDGDGNRISVFKKDIFGNDVEEDGSGKVIRVYKKDIFGNKIVEDGSGKKIGTYKNDFFGKIVFESN